MPDDPSPGMLVVRVTERLARAGDELRRFEAGTDAEGEDEASLAMVGVYFLGAASFAISAVPHIYVDEIFPRPIEFKDAMLPELDRRAEDRITADSYRDSRAHHWLSTALIGMTEACQGAVALEAFEPSDDSDCDDTSEFDEEEDVRSDIADSLIEVAVIAATAGQWLIERQEQPTP